MYSLKWNPCKKTTTPHILLDVSNQGFDVQTENFMTDVVCWRPWYQSPHYRSFLLPGKKFQKAFVALIMDSCWNVS